MDREGKQRGVRGVAVRPNHPRDVFERRLLRAALGDRPWRPPLEVEDERLIGAISALNRHRDRDECRLGRAFGLCGLSRFRLPPAISETASP